MPAAWPLPSSKGEITALGGQSPNHYVVLGVSADAAASEIHSAYRRAALATHPDKEGGSTAAFQQVVAAYEVLSDSVSRHGYDLRLQAHTRWNDVRVQKDTCPPKCKRRHHAKLDAHRFNEKLRDLLQRMSAAARKDVIVNRLTSDQRLALEAHLRKAKSRQPQFIEKKQPESTDEVSIVLRPNGSNLGPGGESKAYGTICRTASAGKTYGYYARVCFHGFGLASKVRKELSCAVGDHIFLQRVMEIVRRHVTTQNQSSLGLLIRCALKEARMLFGQLEDVVAAVHVFISCHHYIGSTNLKLQCAALDDGVDVWEKLHVAKGEALFKGQGITKAYSAAAAQQQWERIKTTYLRLAIDAGQSRERVTARLRRLEDAHRPTRLVRERKLQDMLPAPSTPAATDAGLTRQVQRLLRCHANRLADAKQASSPGVCAVKRKRESSKTQNGRVGNVAVLRRRSLRRPTKEKRRADLVRKSMYMDAARTQARRVQAA